MCELISGPDTNAELQRWLSKKYFEVSLSPRFLHFQLTNNVRPLKSIVALNTEKKRASQSDRERERNTWNCNDLEDYESPERCQSLDVMSISQTESQTTKLWWRILCDTSKDSCQTLMALKAVSCPMCNLNSLSAKRSFVSRPKISHKETYIRRTCAFACWTITYTSWTRLYIFKAEKTLTNAQV